MIGWILVSLIVASWEQFEFILKLVEFHLNFQMWISICKSLTDKIMVKNTYYILVRDCVNVNSDSINLNFVN